MTVAERYPDRLAVQGESLAWTYRELRALVDGVATAIRRLEGPGERIGILTSHDAPVAAAILGVLAAGAAYVPLDPHAPAARLAGIVDDAELALVLVDGAVEERRAELSRLRPELRWLDVTQSDLSRIDPEPAATAAPNPGDIDDVAYLLYTSGSTGQPKGVIQTHRNVLHFIRVYTDALHIAPDDRLAMLAGYGCDAAVMDLFGAVLNGASVHPVDLRRLALRELPATLDERRVSVWHSTPTVFRALIAQLGQPRAAPGPTWVRLVVLGGEAVVGTDFQAFRRHFPSALFVNGFGPTESTLALQFFADAETALDEAGVPIGTAVEGVEVSVEDGSGHPVTTGHVGEIVLRSRHVALGYWRRPAETARAFGTDSGTPGARRYLTGDLARALPCGLLVHAGRADDQLKVRGFRVEPAEIEAMLADQPAVLAAAVTAGSAGQLVAYLVMDDGGRPSPVDLRRSLRRRLPDHMVPTQYVTVDALPQTASGKVDRRALPDPVTAGSLADAGSGDADRPTGTEQVVARIWAELLDVDWTQVGRDDTFLDVGGHSLLLTQVASRCARACT